MILPILLAALAGGVAIFIWGAISWMALPWHHASFSKFENEDAIATAVLASAPKTGLYLMPSPGCGDAKDPAAKKAAQEAAMERMKKGPRVFAVIHREGFTSMAPYMVKGFVVGVVVSALLAYLLTKTAIQADWKRALFVDLTALAGVMAARLNDWNWHGFPNRYTVLHLVDATIGWGLAGWAITAVLPA